MAPLPCYPQGATGADLLATVPAGFQTDVFSILSGISAKQDRFTDLIVAGFGLSLASHHCIVAPLTTDPQVTFDTAAVSVTSQLVGIGFLTACSVEHAALAPMIAQMEDVVAELVRPNFEPTVDLLGERHLANSYTLLCEPLACHNAVDQQNAGAMEQNAPDSKIERDFRSQLDYDFDRHHNLFERFYHAGRHSGHHRSVVVGAPSRDIV
jgi:hypothetical protein